MYVKGVLRLMEILSFSKVLAPETLLGENGFI